MSYLKHPLEVDYLAGIKQDNTKLIQCLYIRFLPRITYYVQQNGGNIEDAEDIFADALEAIWRKIKKQELTLHCSFYTYLFEVCKRLWSKVQRRKKFQSVQSFEQATENILLIEGPTVLPAFRECYLLYQEKWQLLSPSCQQLLFLAIVDNKSMKEIAALMGYKSAGYARKRKHQCLQQLVALIRADARYEELVIE